MLSPPVVGRFDVVEQVGRRVGRSTVAGAIYPLILQAVEVAFRGRVVPTISLAAYQADYPVLFQQRLKDVVRILASPVGEMNQTRRHRQCMLRVCRRLEASLVSGPDTVLSHQTLDAILSRREFAVVQFTYHAGRAVRTFQFLMEGLNQRQHLRVGQPLAIRAASVFPCLIPANADFQCSIGFRQTIRPSIFVNPGKLRNTSHAKYAVASFRISFSRLSQMFSARTRESSNCSGVTTLLPGPFSLPVPTAFTRSRRVYSIIPRSLATAPTLWPAFTRFTVSSLNSGVYSCFGTFFNFISPSNLPGTLYPISWKAKFRGKLTHSTNNPVSKWV